MEPFGPKKFPRNSIKKSFRGSVFLLKKKIRASLFLILKKFEKEVVFLYTVVILILLTFSTVRSKLLLLSGSKVRCRQILQQFTAQTVCMNVP
jgi:hypothetical protein